MHWQSLRQEVCVRILIVDDNPQLGIALSRTLRRMGHEALCASDPLLAVDMVDSAIDAVISDIDMPQMNGVQFAHAILERRANIPIAFCSGSDPQAETSQRAAELGRLLPKPWTHPELESVLDDFAKRICA
jgi:CheY-like chemotaxis protein